MYDSDPAGITFLNFQKALTSLLDPKLLRKLSYAYRGRRIFSQVKDELKHRKQVVGFGE